MTHIFIQKDRRKRYKLVPLVGDCLEKAGMRIPNGAYAIIDSGPRTLRVADFVICNKIAGAISPCCKQIKSINGKTVTVGTSYFDSSKDYEFEPEEILGVVIQVFDRMWHHEIYKRPRYHDKTHGGTV